MIPGRSGIDKAIELIAGQVIETQFLIETQFQRTCHAIVAADLGAALAATMGCEEGQGYLFGRPMPAQAFEGQFLRMPESAIRVLEAGQAA